MTHDQKLSFLGGLSESNEIARILSKALQSFASGFAPTYKNIGIRIKEINDEIGVVEKELMSYVKGMDEYLIPKEKEGSNILSHLTSKEDQVLLLKDFCDRL